MSCIILVLSLLLLLLLVAAAWEMTEGVSSLRSLSFQTLFQKKKREHLFPGAYDKNKTPQSQ